MFDKRITIRKPQQQVYDQKETLKDMMVPLNSQK